MACLSLSENYASRIVTLDDLNDKIEMKGKEEVTFFLSFFLFSPLFSPF